MALSGTYNEHARTSRIALRRLTTGISAMLVLAMAFIGCVDKPMHRSLEDILNSGEITVIARNNAHCYYLYRGEAMGFEYDLAQAFADYLGVKLNVRIAEKWEGMIPELADGSGDFIAASMTITPERQHEVLFSDGYHEIQQHIVVHHKNREIRQTSDLAGHTVHIRKGTSYQNRLAEISNNGVDFRVVLHDDTSTQELISQVADGSIAVTIADSNIALLNRRYHPQIRISGAISAYQRLGWAVHPQATDLHAKINRFFKVIKKNGRFNEIYRRYYAGIEWFDYLDLSAFHRSIHARLPRYREAIRKAADAHGFDWRLIAAQMYQESHFRPTAQSHKGAFGLMQLTKTMAKDLGVKNILDPEENINGGVAYLKRLYDHFDRATAQDRLFIALAAYNIGLGHIWDARDLARERTLDPNRWSSLKETLPLLRDHKYNKNLKFGYARGTEPIKYIKQIMIYYDILKQQSIDYRNTPSAPGEI